MVYMSILNIYRLFEELIEKNPLRDAFVTIIKNEIFCMGTLLSQHKKNHLFKLVLKISDRNEDMRHK